MKHTQTKLPNRVFKFLHISRPFPALISLGFESKEKKILLFFENDEKKKN